MVHGAMRESVLSCKTTHPPPHKVLHIGEKKTVRMGTWGSKPESQPDISFLELDKEQDENVTVYTARGRQPAQHIFAHSCFHVYP